MLMSRKIFNPTEDDLLQIQEMLLQGKTTKEIGEVFGFSKATISRALKKHGLLHLITTKIKYEISDEQIEYIKLLSEQGAGFKVIAALLQVNEYVIRRAMNENSIKKNADNIFIYSQRGKAKFRKENPHLRGEVLEQAYQYEVDKLIEKSKEFSFSSRQVYAQKFAVDDWTKEEIEYLNDNIRFESIPNIANKLNRSENDVYRTMKLNGIFTPISKKRIQQPTTDEFKEDLGNPLKSPNELAKKYSVSAQTIKNWRKDAYGDFKTLNNRWLKKSSAEIEFEEILEELDLAYIFQKELDKWRVDFYLGFKIVIEIQGEYWHSLEKKKEIDLRKKQDLENKGYKVFWVEESQLKDRDSIKKQILDILGFSINLVNLQK